MTRPAAFDLNRSALSGLNLIEASAGTGKTYTISAVFLRLVTEENLPVDRILVVTFTEAATAELKERIRNRLRDGLAFFSGQSDGDGFLEKLAETVDPEEALARLRDALRDFDEAQIFTIHSFCKRMLSENAFESGSLFDTELITDQSAIIQETVEDFWRIHFYNASPLFAEYAFEQIKGPEGLQKMVGRHTGGPDLTIIPPEDEKAAADISAAEAAFSEAFIAVCKAWPEARADVAGLLIGNKALNGNKYQKKSVPKWLENLGDLLDYGLPAVSLIENFVRFTPGGLADGTRKKEKTPEHPFFDLCGDLLEAQEHLVSLFNARIMSLKIRLFDYVRRELRQRKQLANLHSFDDLLLDLRDALHREGGDALALKIRGRYHAALIDEFQDTDPVQYDIFKTVFGSGEHILFLIGDPKQAIYGFRGADIFAYMEAAGHARSRYTLEENWRSEPELIRAVNAVFQGRDRAFVYNEIPFEPVRAPAEKPEEDFLQLDGERRPPLQVWAVPAGLVSEDEKVLTKDQAEEVIIRATTAEISRLVCMGRDGKAMIGNRPVKPGDMAVLVRKHHEAEKIQQALFRLGITSVRHGTGDIFDSPEAGEMERILAALSRPRNEQLIRSALATDIIGVRGEEIYEFQIDMEKWEAWLIRFDNYRKIWASRGFIRMFRQFSAETDVLPRLMAFPDGERRATNLLHLAELVHKASLENQGGETGLVKWLGEQRRLRERRAGEELLRLESDENAVHLVTMHKSKGLEYPVVFCPFTWNQSKIAGQRKKDPILFHDEENSRRLTLDLGSDDSDIHRMAAEKETLAENLRLLYVALTRARNRCYLVWGRFREAGSSAPSYLFHGTEGSADDIVAAADAKFKKLDDTSLVAELEQVRERAGGTIALDPVSTEPGIPCPPEEEFSGTLSSRTFRRKIPRDFRISSFSSLISGQRHNPELADYDTLSLPENSISDENPVPDTSADKAGPDIFAFPGGTKAGTCLHTLFEHLDFTQARAEILRERVKTALNRYGFESLWTEAVCGMVQNVLAVPLADAVGNLFTLSQIRSEERINELAFYFPLKPLTPLSLKRVFARHTGAEIAPDFPDQIGRLGFSPVRGFMKGFIDLVFRHENRFYIVDWKSNLLGETTAHYAPDALKRIMYTQYYVLQYHVYVLALHRYLKMRIRDYRYETHFGGVFYLFLRGIDPKKGPEYGVFRDRPESGLIDALDENLIADRRLESL